MKVKIIRLFLFIFIVATIVLIYAYKQRSPIKITHNTPIFLTADKGKLWDTNESVTRITTKFSPREIEKTFTTSNDELHAYKNWDFPDAPYASAFTKNSYSNYVLELEFKWGEGKHTPRLNKPRDAGIIFHVYGHKNTPWPSGMEYQLKEPNQYGGLVTVRTRASVKQLGNIYNENAPEIILGKRKGASHLDINPVGKTINSDWNKIKLEVSGDSAVYYLNGKKVMQYQKAEYFNRLFRQWRPLTRGRIILQAEGAEIQYRNIILRPIENKTPK